MTVTTYMGLAGSTDRFVKLSSVVSTPLGVISCTSRPNPAVLGGGGTVTLT